MSHLFGFAIAIVALYIMVYLHKEYVKKSLIRILHHFAKWAKLLSKQEVVSPLNLVIYRTFIFCIHNVPLSPPPLGIVGKCIPILVVRLHGPPQSLIYWKNDSKAHLSLSLDLE